MAQWQDFFDFFSSEEQEFIQYGFKSDIETLTGITEFSEIYPFSEDKIRGIIGQPGAFQNYVSTYIFSKAAGIAITGSDDDQWNAYKDQFSNDYKDAIQFLIDELKKAPYSYTFANYQSTSSGSVVNTILNNHNQFWGFYSFFSIALKNRIKQATDCWNVMENAFSGNERLKQRELFRLFQTLPKYDVFQKFLNTSTNELAADLKQYLLYYAIGNGYYLDFLVDDLSDKINDAKLLNLSEEGIKAQVMGTFRQDKRNAIEALAGSLISLGLISKFSDISSLPLKTMEFDTDLSTEYVRGFQLQPNFDFSEKGRGWYLDIYGTPISNSNIINSERYRFTSGAAPIYSSEILEVGKTYIVEYTIATSNDSSNVFKVYDNATEVDSVTNPVPGTIRTFEVTATSGFLKFSHSSGSGLVDITNVKVYEKIFPSQSSVKVTQVADDTHPQITQFTLYYDGVAPGDKVFLYLNHLLTYVTVDVDSIYNNTRDALIDAINSAAEDDASGWAGVSAAADGDKIVVTGYENGYSYLLKFFSLKQHILDLADNNQFYYNLALDLQHLGQTAFTLNTETFEFNGRLLQSETSAPLQNLRVVLTDTDAIPEVDLGSEITNGSGHFSFKYNITYPAKYARNFKLELFDGIKINEWNPLHVIEDLEYVDYLFNYYPALGPASNSIADVLTLEGLTMPTDLGTFLSSHQINTLPDIRNAGGLKYISGLPVAQDNPVVIILDKYASLDATSKNLSVNKALIAAGYSNPLDLGLNPRPEVVSTLEANNVGSFNASQVHYVSKAYGALLQNIITGHLGSTASGQTIGTLNDELDPIFKPSCSCTDCGSAVSPLAYLTDLINYAIKYVRNGEATIDISYLEEHFFQQFTDLPHSCKSTEDLVCQQRIAIEILRRYIASLTLPSGNLTTLASESKDYCFAVYRDLLKEIGTSFEQLRNFRTATNDEKANLAEMLSFPFYETFDPFSELFVDPLSDDMNEQTLEVLFGIIDTRRDNLSTGAKLNDGANQITRWQLSGIKYQKNTDEEGFIYLKITSSPDKVLLYNNQDVTNDDYLVGSAEGPGVSGRLSISPENESGLSGNVYITNFTATTSIKISILPKVMCWRLKNIKDQWESNDWPANDFVNHLLPVIDPDLIGPDDFRVPDVLVNPKFEVWKTRRIWVDGLYSTLSGEATVQDMLNLMGTSKNYTTFASVVYTHTPWSSVPDLAALKVIYTKLKQGDAADIADANTSIAGFKLTTESFLRLYEIYNNTFVNDEKGLIVRLNRAASTSLKQITWLTPSPVNIGDRYTITYIDSSSVSHSISYTASTSEVTDLLNGLKTAIQAVPWDLDITLSPNNDYLILTGPTVNSAFQIKTKALRVPSADDLKDMVSILLQAIKLTFYADWITEEGTESVSINSNDFWVSAVKPTIGDWPIISTGKPMIDPEKIHSQDLAGRMFASGPRSTLQDRNTALVELKDTIRNTRESDSLDAVLVYAWGSTYLGTYSKIEDILSDLENSTDPDTANAAEEYIISNLYITADQFRILMQVREKSLDLNESPVTNDEWNTVYSILTSAYKERVLYSTWLSEETSSSYFYWQIFKFALPKWRSTLNLRTDWEDGLELMSNPPALDPDIVRPDFLAVIDQDLPSYTIWRTRNATLGDLFTKIKGLFEGTDSEVSGLGLTPVQAFDYIINKYIVTTLESARIIQLYQDAHDGLNVSSEISQLNLTFEALEFLNIIRSVLVDSPSEILPEEKESVYSILVQVQKERNFSTWILEEKDQKVNVSPDHFQISKYYRNNFFSEKENRVMYWRISNEVKRDWIDLLQARIVTWENTFSFFSDIVDRAEDKYLINLRDSLIRATITDGEDFKKHADDLTEKLLIDVENNCCQKTTRVSQAIEALQLLFFSIRTGQLQDDYPDLSIQSDYFDDEWKWMGSYATWRSAMFVTLYPENLLHPALRKTGSSPFFQLVNAFQNENNLTPLQASCFVADYFDYIKDIGNLTIIAHTPADTFIQAGRCGKGSGEAVYINSSESKTFQFVFAQSNLSKKIYWSALDGNDAAVFSPKPWEELTPFSDVAIVKIIGAVTWAPSNSETYLLFFAQTSQTGKEQLSYAKFDLTTGQWNSERVDVDIDNVNDDQIDTSSVFLNRSKPGIPQKEIDFVLVGTVKSSEGKLTKRVKYYKLDGKGNSIKDFKHPFNDKTNITRVYDVFDNKLFYEYVEETVHPSWTDTYQEVSISILGVTQTLDFVEKVEDVTLPVLPPIKGKKITFRSGGSIVYAGADILDVKTITNVYPQYSTFGPPQIFIGDQKIDGLDLGSYIGCFTWPEGKTSASTSFLYYKKTNETGISYRMFSSSQDVITVEPVPISGKSSFITNNFISLFNDSHGNVYSIYQRITDNPGIFIAPLYRLNTVSSTSGARVINVLYIKPNSPVVKLAYSFTSTDALTTNTDTDNLKNLTRTAYETNSGLPYSFQQVISEAYYFVPMMAALSLQNKGFYTEALDWYRLVYAYDKPESATGSFSPRKIWYGLIKEETFLQDIRRSQNWLRDPLNPHAIAETRAYSYTKFTVLSIIKCMLAFADSEFTKDNAESVPKARVLYETALDLLDLQGLRTSGSDCTASIQAITLPDSITNSSEWPEWQPVWLGVLEDLYSIEDKEELENVISLIETELATSNTIDQKLSYVRDLVDDTLETPEQFADFASLISSGRIMSIDALNRVLMNSGIEAGLKYFVSEVSKQYLNAVTSVTGIVPDALLSDNVHISWFGDHVNMIQEIPATPVDISTMTNNLPVNPYASRRNAYYNYINPTAQQVRTMTVISDPITVINSFYGNEQYYIPQVNPNFCVPPNPLLNSLIFSAEANLYKIRNCMNIAGMIRQLLPYAAPTDQFTGLPILGGDGRLITTGTQNFQPTIYRFDVLIERAKQQVNVAQQIEATLLSMYEKSDNEHYTLMKAKQDLGLASAGVKLQDLRLKEADSNILLAQLQKDRVTITADHFQGLISEGLLASELASIAFLYISQGFLISSSILSGVAAGIDFAEEVSVAQGFSNLASASSTMASVASTQSSIFAMQASFERRKQDWQFQLDLAHQDLLISNQQITIAKENYNIVEQEKAIAQLQYDNAQQTLDFLSTKFTNAELYDWMITILEKAYSYFLYQATSTAKIAQNQLAFERQEPIPTFIQDDYWQAPSTYALSLGGNSTGPDRRGMTGSVRLLQDVSQLEQSAFDTEKRKLQLTKTISLMRIAPTDFQRFKETGVLRFCTNMDMFDRDFPGHYLRLVKQVKVSVIALVPPIDGIKATLRNAGLSYIVNGTDFRKNTIIRTPDSVSLSSPFNATGVFELNQQSQKLLNPFEDMGVESTWEFIMPKPSNFFDYSTIADVLLTIEYTALESSIYRNQVIERIDSDFLGDRSFSFKNNFADQWFDLSNSENQGKDVTVTFNTTAFDFPANLKNLKTRAVALFFATENTSTGQVALAFKEDSTGKVSGPISKGFEQILSSSGNASSWSGLIENKSPIGEWQLTLTSDIINKIISEEITDIYFVLTVKGTTPEWPSY